jgi:hypothetical protein
MKNVIRSIGKGNKGRDLLCWGLFVVCACTLCLAIPMGAGAQTPQDVYIDFLDTTTWVQLSFTQADIQNGSVWVYNYGCTQLTGTPPAQTCAAYAQINCSGTEANKTVCSARFPLGTKVYLLATPTPSGTTAGAPCAVWGASLVDLWTTSWFAITLWEDLDMSLLGYAPTFFPASTVTLTVSPFVSSGTQTTIDNSLVFSYPYDSSKIWFCQDPSAVNTKPYGYTPNCSAQFPLCSTVWLVAYPGAGTLTSTMYYDAFQPYTNVFEYFLYPDAYAPVSAQKALAASGSSSQGVKASRVMPTTEPVEFIFKDKKLTRTR